MATRFCMLIVAAQFFYGCDTEPEVFAELEFQAPSDSYFTAGAYPPQTAQEFGESVDAVVRKITYPFVLNRALRAPGIVKLGVFKDQPDPIDWLDEHLKITTTKYSKSAFIRIGVDNGVPSEDAAKIVQVVCDAAMIEVVDELRQRQQEETDDLRKLLEQMNNELKEKRNDLRQFQSKIVAAATEQASQEQLRAATIAELSKRFAEHEYQLMLAEVDAAFLRPAAETSGDAASATPPEEDGEHASGHAAIQARIRREAAIIARLQGSLDAAAKPSVGTHNALVVIDEQIKRADVDRLAQQVDELSELVRKRELASNYEAENPRVMVRRKAEAR